MSSFMNADLGSDSDSDDGDFDPKKETHTGNFAEDANQLLKDPNNKGFEIPSLDKV